MSEVVRLKRKPRLHIVSEDEAERVFGSRDFIPRARNVCVARSPAHHQEASDDEAG